MQQMRLFVEVSASLKTGNCTKILPVLSKELTQIFS